MSEPKPCETEIYNNGEVVAIVADRDADAIEKLVKSIALRTHQRIDWHYIGGRGVVKCIGNSEWVRDEFRRYENHWIEIVEK